MSLRPSPSKSTASVPKFDGMNCGWPIAPAHEPTILARAMWPSCRIFSAWRKFVAEEVRPVLRPRQRRERADHVEPASIGAERGLDSPQRQEDPAIDSVLFLDRVERVLPRARFLRRARDARCGRHAVHIGADRRVVLRLTRRRGDHALIGREARKGRVERLARNPALRGVRPERLRKRLLLLRLLRARGRSPQHRNRQKRKPQERCHPTSGRLRRFSIHV